MFPHLENTTTCNVSKQWQQTIENNKEYLNNQNVQNALFGQQAINKNLNAIINMFEIFSNSARKYSQVIIKIVE